MKLRDLIIDILKEDQFLMYYTDQKFSVLDVDNSKGWKLEISKISKVYDVRL